LTSKDVTQRVEHTPLASPTATPAFAKIRNADEGLGFLIGFAPTIYAQVASKCHSAFIFLRQKQTEQ